MFSFLLLQVNLYKSNMFPKISKTTLRVAVIGIVLYVLVWAKRNCDRSKEGISIATVLAGFHRSLFPGQIKCIFAFDNSKLQIAPGKQRKQVTLV